MMLNREEALKVVTDGLSWIVKDAELRGTIHLFDSHIIFQEVFRRLLNELHGLQLEVTDSIHQNFPAIDLGDEANKRCFQVTSESSGRKIQLTLDAYATHKLKPRYGKLQVVVIGKRQRTYSLKVPPGVSFDWKKDIIDSKELVRQINAAGTDTILRIRTVIEQEIHLPGMGSQVEGKPLQSSKIASFHLPLKFPTLGDSTEVDIEVFGKFSDVLLDALSRCFQHACVSTSRDDFVFLLTLARSDRETDPGYVPFDFEVICHVTEFVRVLEARLGFIYAGRPSSPPRLRKFGGDQEAKLNSGLGRYMPHRIWRDPPSAIRIQLLDGIPATAGRNTTTSAMLCLLSAGLNQQTVLVGNQFPDLEKVLKVFDRKKGWQFSLDSINLDPNDPESWEYRS